jgi:hypothetical protein
MQDRKPTVVLVHGAFADKGENANELASKFEGSTLGQALRPVPITRPDGSQDVDLYEEVRSSHAVTVSRPDAVTRVIEKAAEAVR